MVIGNTKWLDQDVNDKDENRDKIRENFENLSIKERYSIFEQLKFPKSNILMAAELLSKIKNRANRFPNLSRNDFVANEHAVEIVATEYNVGATNSSIKDAVASPYGIGVWNNLNFDVVIEHYFPNT